MLYDFIYTECSLRLSSILCSRMEIQGFWEHIFIIIIFWNKDILKHSSVFKLDFKNAITPCIVFSFHMCDFIVTIWIADVH